jgi:DNA-binding NarL/FixJ family response regulator
VPQTSPSSRVPPEEPVRLIVVEDHAALRQGLGLLLGRQGCVIVGSVGCAREAWDLVRQCRPDVIVIDLNLPDESGAALARRLLADDRELGVLLYTGSEDRETLSDALDSGARGVAVKAAPPNELIDAIRIVARGGAYVDPRVKALLRGRSVGEDNGILSAREREILDLLSKGLTGEDAAKELFLSPETVRTHVRNAMQKLEANTRVHAIAIALQHGEIEL